MAGRDDIPKTDTSEIEALLKRLKHSNIEICSSTLGGIKPGCRYLRRQEFCAASMACGDREKQWGKGDYIMKRTLFRFFIAAMMIGGILPMTGLAQGYGYRRHGGINRRQDHQRDRIRNGIRSGELTRREAGRLIYQQRRIEAYERRSRLDDGRLDRHERRRLNRMLDRSSRDIYRQKNYGQNRFW
jgi:hypothetical protein